MSRNEITFTLPISKGKYTKIAWFYKGFTINLLRRSTLFITPSESMGFWVRNDLSIEFTQNIYTAEWMWLGI